jgi:TetR/AcrR family transcriptional regulator
MDGDQMPDTTLAESTWAERAADRSPVVQRSRSRGVQQAKSIVEAARRLIEVKGPTFTTQELVKEAGIALQTFYRYFPGKDHLLLAVIEDTIEESCATYRYEAQELVDPVDRLRFYVTSPIRNLEEAGIGPSFITIEHWRLQALYPDEISRATRPFTDLVVEGIAAGCATGELATPDPPYAAWLITQLVMAVFHHYDCAGMEEPAERIAERVWQFCLGALGRQSPTEDAGPSPRVAALRGTDRKEFGG